MVSSLLHPLLSQHGVVAYTIVGVLVFAEAAILFGFVFPGETAVIHLRNLTPDALQIEDQLLRQI